MSLLDILLGPCPKTPGRAHRPRNLALQDGLVLYLQEDESEETLTIYSVPGTIDVDDWVSGLSEPWSQSLPHPGHVQARSELIVEPATGRVFLSSVWPRMAFDTVTFDQQLLEHAQHHRRLADTLATGFDVSDLPPPMPGLSFA